MLVTSICDRLNFAYQSEKITYRCHFQVFWWTWGR